MRRIGVERPGIDIALMT